MFTLPLATALAAAVLSTSFISGIFGMAGGMILMGILLALLPVATAMVLHGLTQMASNGWRAWMWRSHIAWQIAGHYAAGAVAATLAFATLGFVPGKPTALIILALISFGGLLAPRRFAPDVRRWGHGFGCGALCTLLQLVAGVSGPILDVFFVRSDLGRKEMVATKAAIQVFGHSLKVAYFGQLLLGGGHELAPAAVILAIALALVGTQASRRVLEAISDAQFRRWTRSLVAVIAAICLIQGLVLLAADLPAVGAVLAAGRQ
jgi:uncharacterized membrane protein YfcA